MDTRPLDALIRKLDGGSASNWLRGAAEEVKNDIVDVFNSGPAGRAYPRGNGKVHYASSPGYPPNIDTGALRASWRVIPKGKLTFWVATDKDYAPGLEFGTTRIAPRPYIRPVFDNWSRNKLKRSLEAWIKR